MKNIVLVLGLVAGIWACNKNITDENISSSLPVSTDNAAGSWKTYILQSPDEINVAAPTAITSDAYLAELNTVKTGSANLSKTQQDAVNYWSAGAVYRWNEIARELAAKYNIPPASNAEGKYPVPDAANPLADPHFPFANPPYAARAFAYLAVAQYDALVSTWYYKFKYNRAAPSTVNAAIVPKLPLSSLPSYPSEDAVVAGASYTVLAAMFPGEIPYLTQKLEEAKFARIWAAMNVQSDISAGETLGKSVAAKILAKAKTDGMAASNNQSVTTGLIANAKNIGMKNIWVSQESPLRPPLLPNYGTVNTWNFDKATMVAIRPAIPYIEGSAEFDKDLEELKKIHKNQTREQARIANFWADGPGSFTPPGHWNRTAGRMALNAKFSEIRTARTMALVGTALMDAGIACWDTKYYYYSPRPQQYSLKTSVGLPNFPSYTSGHSTFSSAAATVLEYIFPANANEFKAQALEASNSRIYGLIHFRLDCEMGLVHGKRIGDYAIERGKNDGSGL